MFGWLHRWAAFFRTARFVRFLLFGGLAALVNLAVGALIYSTPSFSVYIPFGLAVGVGSTAGLIVNFSLNYVYNFRYRGRGLMAQFRTFIIVALVGVGLTSIAADVALSLCAWLGAGPLVGAGPMTVSTEFFAHLVAVGLVTFYSFAAHSTFSFNKGIRVGLRRMSASRDSLHR